MKTNRSAADKHRLMINLAKIGFPEIPLLGAYSLSAATKGLAEHAHPDTVEICYLKKGEQIYTIAGQDYLLKGNDVFITYPGEKHSTGGNPEGKGTLYWVQVKIPLPRNTFLGLTPAHARPLLLRLKHIPTRHFRGTPKLQVLFENIISKHENARTDPLARLSIGATLIEWLLLVIEQSARAEKQTLSRDIEQVIQQMNQELEENPSMDDYAASIHLSASRFKAKFKEQVGIPPGEYSLRCKIEAAKTRLKTVETPITDLAFELGFSSSQYFATTFKRFENMTPGEYRKSITQTPPSTSA